MTHAFKAKSPATNVRDRIIVALDVESGDEARAIVRELGPYVGAFKVGLQLFSAAGPDIVREFASSGKKIFLDLKFHDIPNTVAKASIAAAKLGVWMFNMHIAGGSEMLRESVGAVDDVCEREKIDRPLILGVTVLTSSNALTLRDTGISRDIETQVVELGRLGAECGLDGVVASSLEVVALQNAIPDKSFLTVTPGIRPANATDDDQKRVTTFRQALANGSDYVVIGRPVLQAIDRVEAIEEFIAAVS